METGVAFKTKSDFAYRVVRDRIVSGDLAPGAAIQQRDLAAELGISTTPLREAMRRLHADGLVELDSHKDARVSALRAQEAQDLLELRLALDPLAASLAAQRRTEADLTALQSALAALRPLPSPPSLDDLVRHRQFHQAVYRAAHNVLLEGVLDTLWDKADRYRLHGLRSDPGQRHRDAKSGEHRRIVNAIAKGDAAAAEEVMRAHIDSSHGAHALVELGEAGA